MNFCRTYLSLATAASENASVLAVLAVTEAGELNHCSEDDEYHNNLQSHCFDLLVIAKLTTNWLLTVIQLLHWTE